MIGFNEPRGTDSLTATLQFNLAFAAVSSAYQTWQADESFDQYLQRLRRCLDQAGAGPAAKAN